MKWALAEEGEVEDRESVVDQLDMAATAGEEACPCPEESEPVVLDLDQIVPLRKVQESEEEGFEEEARYAEPKKNYLKWMRII